MENNMTLKQTFCPLIKTICRHDCVFRDGDEDDCSLAFGFANMPYHLFQIHEDLERIRRSMRRGG
jgi:hypothetical protein